MTEKPDIIDRMATLKIWQIIALGGAAFVAALLLVTLVAHLCYIWFPAHWTAVAIGHILAAGLAGWYVPKPFIQAYWLHKCNVQIEAMCAALHTLWVDEPEDDGTVKA